MAARMRVATSGTHALSDDYGDSAPTAGRVLTSLGAGLPPDWVAPAPGVLPIARTLVVDGVFGVDATATGTFALPFRTLQAAINRAVANAWTNVQLLIAPTTYADAVAIPLGIDVTFHGWDPIATAILGGDFTITGPVAGGSFQTASWTNCTITATVIQTAGAGQNLFLIFDHSDNAATIAANDLILQYQQSVQNSAVIATGTCAVRWDGPSWAYTLQSGPTFPVGTVNRFFDAGHDTYARALTVNGVAIGTTAFVPMAVNALYVKQNDRVSIQVVDPSVQDFICGIHGVGVAGTVTAWITNLSRASTNFNEAILLLVHHETMVAEPAP